MSQRLFIALDLPADCRHQLASLATPIRGVRWIPEHQLHLTLAFLGDVAPEPHARLLETLSAIRVPPFVLRIEALGTFGRGRVHLIQRTIHFGHRRETPFRRSAEEVEYTNVENT